MSGRKGRIQPGQMDEQQRALYEKIAHGPRAAGSAFPLVDDAGALTGPFDAMLLAPALGDALQALGSALRFRGQLTDRAREMAILLVAHHHGSEFEVFAHEAVGRQLGLSESDLGALADCRAPESADKYESEVSNLVNHLLQYDELDDRTYRSVTHKLGEEVVFEVSTLVGYYSLLAVQLKIFD
jgi:4-carboxymuconolactone decarboxylase